MVLVLNVNGLMRATAAVLDTGLDVLGPGKTVLEIAVLDGDTNMVGLDMIVLDIIGIQRVVVRITAVPAVDTCLIVFP